MGTWGPGPFDSDGALDMLAFLAAKYADVNDVTDEIIPDSVDHAGVTDALREILDPQTCGEPADVYAAIGLVAAARDETIRRDRTGTRLFSPDRDGAGLVAHCGYVALLRPEDADALADTAACAADSLRDLSEETLSIPALPPGARDILVELADALA